MSYDIEYRVLDSTYIDEALELVIKTMTTHEPAIRSFLVDEATTEQTFREIFLPIRQPLLDYGISSVAIDKTNNKVVGCRITEDYVEAPGAPPLNIDNEPLKAFLSLWQKFDSDWEKTKPQPIIKGQWAHWMGVAVNSEYGKAGIAQKLYEHNIDLLKSKGYLGAICENTSAYSSRSAEKAGVKLIYSHPYATWEYNGKFPITCVPHPHVELALREVVF